MTNNGGFPTWKVSAKDKIDAANAEPGNIPNALALAEALGTDVSGLIGKVYLTHQVTAISDGVGVSVWVYPEGNETRAIGRLVYPFLFSEFLQVVADVKAEAKNTTG